ncbi:MAG: hypothetical protein PF450_02895 [Bacteroidales bacterium]|jgi:hypothetical protein|nr:hypothetical protein [Bacteroidales bacterium]
MRRLPLIIIPLLIVAKLVMQGFNPTDSPHGKSLKISCSVCHTSDGWIMDESNTFNHATTSFHLAGQHSFADCKACHPSLVFNEAGSNCIDCHADMHQQTLGMSCERCHTEESWLVSNIFEIHQMGRFPLLGSHAVADCQDCHHTESLLRFEPLGVECYDCHSQTYLATTFPNHQSAGYSISCEECHNINSFEWTASGINHNFFPLTQGHAINDCAQCHNVNDYKAISPDCFSCHEADYKSVKDPNHLSAGFSTDCELCHTTVAGWKPSTFDHDGYFPIYSGKHAGEWNTCTDCHTNSSNYAVFSCTDCHEHTKSKMDDEHDDERDYVYVSSACLNCHPQGIADD